MQTNTERERKRERWYAKKHKTSKLENEAMYTLYVYHKNKDDLMTNLFISLYPFYFIILAAKTATQITNIILPTWKRGYVYKYTCTTETKTT